MSSIIDMTGVSKTYGRGRKARQALDRLTLTVESGQVFGFIGPNGAGKSTAIKILIGLVQPTAGHATIAGEPCGTPASRRHLGYLPETATYHELLTVTELLTRHASLAGLAGSEIARRCDEVLEVVELRERAGSRIRELSKGMVQRFGLAQALIGRPSLLVLDEPTSGLDPIAQRHLKTVMARLRAEGTTIFFSSHQLTEIELMCDAVAILHRGQLLTCAPLNELLKTRDCLRVRATAADGVVQTLRDRGWTTTCQENEVQLDVTQDCVNEVVDIVRGAGASLLSVETQRPRLEDTYFELVAREGLGTETRVEGAI